MRFELSLEDLIQSPKADLLIVNLFEGVETPGGATGAVDKALGGAITEAIRQGVFKGKRGETHLVLALGKLPQKRVLVVGLGKASDFSLDVVRSVGRAAGRAAARQGAQSIATVAHGAGTGALDPALAAEATLVATAQGAYTFTEYQAEKRPGVESVTLISTDKAHDKALSDAVLVAAAIAEGQALTRDLVNIPPNDKLPEVFAQKIAAAGKKFGFKVDILSVKDLEKMGAGGILAVGKGSVAPPVAVWMEAGEGKKAPIGLLGKGMTYDSGGLNIKTGDGMSTMKSDMAGAAAVVGAMAALGRLKPRTRVRALVMCAENMPSGSAFRAGDVLTMLSGKTVEMLNSDAEGRLILADGVELLKRDGVRGIIDLATLTGACVVALGGIRAGALANDEGADLMSAVKSASVAAGDLIWEMPHDPGYREMLKSHLADMKNVGGRGGGMITGGLFIGEFAGELPWVHLDVAGVTFHEDDKDNLAAGATGFGTELLVRLAQNLSE